MSDVFRCDYCGQYAPLSRASYAIAHDYTNGDGDDVYTVTITCGVYCASSVATVRVGGR
jgi:hypothetical protein